MRSLEDNRPLSYYIEQKIKKKKRELSRIYRQDVTSFEKLRTTRDEITALQQKLARQIVWEKERKYQ